MMKSQDLDFAIKALAVADVNNDGKKELVLTNGKKVMVFSQHQGELSLIWEEAERNKQQHLSLDIADINNNGYPEIFVTNYQKPHLASYVLEYQEGSYQRIAENIGYFLRLLPLEGEPELLGQKLGTSQTFARPLYRLAWQEGTYEKRKSWDLPLNLSIYGISCGDVNNDGQAELVFIDDYDRLRVYSLTGDLLWKSTEH